MGDRFLRAVCSADVSQYVRDARHPSRTSCDTLTMRSQKVRLLEQLSRSVCDTVVGRPQKMWMLRRPSRVSCETNPTDGTGRARRSPPRRDAGAGSSVCRDAYTP